jgi:2-isopropylmalate synthase
MVTLAVQLRDGDTVSAAEAIGYGPINAFLQILADRGLSIELFDYAQHTLSAGGDAQAAAYVELQIGDKRLWGVGIDADTSSASFRAIVSAVNRAVRSQAASETLVRA